jgi:hypothetical protein
MVAKCANPSCKNVFRYLRKGKLFLVEHPRLPAPVDNDFRESGRKREYFWLCDDCALTMTIASDGNGYALLGWPGARAAVSRRSISKQSPFTADVRCSVIAG